MYSRTYTHIYVTTMKEKETMSSKWGGAGVTGEGLEEGRKREMIWS